MRILFLVPNWNLHKKHYCATIPAPIPPLEFLYSASLLKKNHNVKICDAYLLNLSNREIVEYVKSYAPDVIVITTAPTYLFWRCCPLDIETPSEISKLLKREIRDVKIIIMGPQGTVSPRWVLEKTNSDFLVRGEPDLCLADFINSDLDKPQEGICSREKIVAPVIVPDLKKLPAPAYDLLDLKRYKFQSWNQQFLEKIGNPPGAIIEFSRGCPFSCFYCFKTDFRNEFRVKSVGQAIREVKLLKKLGIRHLHFIDEIFNMPTENLKSFLRELHNEKIFFTAQCRVDVMSEEILHLMADAGCMYIEWGLESYDVNILKALKKDEDLQKVKRTLSLADTLIEHNYIAPISRMYFGAPEVKKILGLEKIETENSRYSYVPIAYPSTYFFNELIKMYPNRENAWEFAQKYVWYENLYKSGIQIPFRIFRRIPFPLLSSIFSLTASIPSTYFRAMMGFESSQKKYALDKIIDLIFIKRLNKSKSITNKKG